MEETYWGEAGNYSEIKQSKTTPPNSRKRKCDYIQKQQKNRIDCLLNYFSKISFQENVSHSNMGDELEIASDKERENK